MTTAELRHIATSVHDRWLAAESYRRIFGFGTVGETGSSLAEGVG